MYINKILTLALGAILLLSASCDNQRTRPDARELTFTIEKPEPSPMFWDYAASTSMLHTELGRLAKEKSKKQQVTAFADSAVRIHSNALRSLQTIAVKYTHVQLPDSLSGADRSLVDEFKKLEGEEFEMRYLEYLKSTHQKQYSRFQQTLSETEDPALRRWLNSMKARLQNQLKQYSLLDSVKEEEI
jgi:putative membrane protein